MEPTPITGPWQIAYTEEVDQTPDASRDLVATDRMLLGAGWLADAAGNAFEAWYYLLQGTNTSAVVVQRRNPAGVVTGAWEIAPPVVQGKEFKLDSASIRRAGTRIVIAITAHEISSLPTRLNLYAVLHLDNVATDAGGRDLDGWPVLDSVFNAPDVEPPPGPGYTLDQIAEAVLRAIKTDMGGELGGLIQSRAKNGARQGIQTEARDANGALLSLSSQEGFLQGLRDGLYSWQRDRNYEAGIEALRHAPDESILTQAARRILQPPK